MIKELEFIDSVNIKSIKDSKKRESKEIVNEMYYCVKMTVVIEIEGDGKPNIRDSLKTANKSIQEFLGDTFQVSGITVSSRTAQHITVQKVADKIKNGKV